MLPSKFSEVSDLKTRFKESLSSHISFNYCNYKLIHTWHHLKCEPLIMKTNSIGLQTNQNSKYDTLSRESSDISFNIGEANTSEANSKKISKQAKK